MLNYVQIGSKNTFVNVHAISYNPAPQIPDTLFLKTNTKYSCIDLKQLDASHSQTLLCLVIQKSRGMH